MWIPTSGRSMRRSPGFHFLLSTAGKADACAGTSSGSAKERRAWWSQPSGKATFCGAFVETPACTSSRMAWTPGFSILLPFPRRVAEMVDTGETAEELAARIVSLLGDSEAARRQGLAGRARVAEEYRWDAALDRLLEVVESPIPA